MCKVLLSTANFPPLVNGVSRVLSDIASVMPPDKLIVLAPWCQGIMKSDAYNTDSKEAAQVFDAKQSYPVIRYYYSMQTKMKTIVSTIWLTVLTVWYALYHKVDLVYFGKPFPVASAGLVLHFFGIPYVVHCHGSELVRKRGKLAGKIRDRVLNQAFKVITVSNWTKNTCLKLGCDNEKIFVLNPKVDVERMKPTMDLAAFRKAEGLENKKILLTVAHINHQKGQHLVIEALPKVLEQHPDLVYVIAGAGPDEEALKETVLQMGLENNVYFPGNRDIVNFFNLCDVFVMASLYIETGFGGVESFGIVYIEASACAKPVIGSNHGGIPDAVEHGVSGILFETGNIEQLSDAIVTLFNNPDYAKQLGEQGYQRILERFTIKEYANELNDQVFNPLASAKQSSSS